MAIIIDGKELAKKIRQDLKVEVDKLREKKVYPKLAVIMVEKIKHHKFMLGIKVKHVTKLV